jgi:hypothetical protein
MSPGERALLRQPEHLLATRADCASGTACQRIKLVFFPTRSKWRHGTRALLLVLISLLIRHDDTDSDSFGSISVEDALTAIRDIRGVADRS